MCCSLKVCLFVLIEEGLGVLALRLGMKGDASNRVTRSRLAATNLFPWAQLFAELPSAQACWKSWLDQCKPLKPGPVVLLLARCHSLNAMINSQHLRGYFAHQWLQQIDFR